MAESPFAPVSLDVSAIPSRPAGAGRYVVELVRALDRSGEVPLTLVARRGDSARWSLLAPGGRVLAPVPATRPGRLAYEQALLGPYLRRLRPPGVVHHGPHYTLPSGLGPIAGVVTIHDLTFFDRPEWHERSKVAFFRRAISRSVALASGIICVSATTAARLETILAPRVPVTVIPHGIDHGRFRPEADAAADWAALATLGIPEGLEMVTHLGTLEPRKGIVDLVEAFALMASRRELAPRELRRPEPSRSTGETGPILVLAGLPGWGAPEIHAAISRSAHAGRVRVLGYVDDAAVPALLRRSRVVAYPSREEGFGLPALEAMACGAPLVTTRGTAMAEFAGSAAWTVPPGDVEALATALEAGLAVADAERAQRRAEGIERASAFSWDLVGASHIECYRAAARRRGEAPGRM